MELTEITHDRPTTGVLQADDMKKTDTNHTDLAYSEAPLKRSLAQRHLVRRMAGLSEGFKVC